MCLPCFTAARSKEVAVSQTRGLSLRRFLSKGTQIRMLCVRATPPSDNLLLIGSAGANTFGALADGKAQP